MECHKGFLSTAQVMVSNVFFIFFLTWGNASNLTNIFQSGCFNRQLEKIVGISVATKREWDEIALILLIHCSDILIHD